MAKWPDEEQGATEDDQAAMDRLMKHLMKHLAIRRHPAPVPADY